MIKIYKIYKINKCAAIFVGYLIFETFNEDVISSVGIQIFDISFISKLFRI
jgi:hypothetical protein